ncbi:MAG TPA: hypothetical protein VK694_01340 [Verrucomicrobiae bacterium]|nr:hypothetical protein [Verrucomicrobiae bacterium]
MKYFSEPFAKKFLWAFNVVLSLQIIFYIIGTLVSYLTIDKQDGWLVSAAEPLALVWVVLSVATLIMLPILLLFVKDKKQVFNRTTNILLILFGIQLIILKPLADWISDLSISFLGS